MSSSSASYRAPLRRMRLARRARPGWIAAVRDRPELAGLVALAAALNFWSLGLNGWANTFYSAAVRSMASSWHDFLFASLDRSGLMTVDKPPLSLWVQALSARIFGFHPLSILVPQALMGVAVAVLVYDLVRRRFGRAAAFAAGLALVLTPITVAMSRHNNPDELLILCCVAAVWFALRALEDGRTKWLVLSGVCVGLGFEAKMAAALLIVPGIALAYVWVAPRGRLTALRQLTLGGVAMAVVGLAWPVLVTLTPAADRPWISGTADNSIWSLMFNYNGLGRVTGQAGAPTALGGIGPANGGDPGVLRLLNSSLGGQAGWLLGFALVAGLALLAATRLRRADPRTGWLIAVGGAALVSAVVFSYAQGIFHPYYVSFLAPFSAALIGAGVGQVAGAARSARWARALGPLLIAGGVLTDVVVVGHVGGVSWARPLAVAAGAVCAGALVLRLSPRVRLTVLGAGLAALLAAPAAWAVDTLGYPTSSTFPAGGPQNAAFAAFGGPGRHGFRPLGGFPGGSGGLPGGGSPGGSGGLPGGSGGLPGGSGGSPGGGSPGGGVAPHGGSAAPGVPRLPTPGAHRFINAVLPPVPGSFGGRGGFVPGRGGLPGSGRFGPGGGRWRPFGFAGGFGRGSGGAFGGDTAGLNAAVSYARAHGGGTLGVESQSAAAAAILASDANVAGLGGFSGRESSVSAAWLAMEVRDGRLRWILPQTGQGLAGPADGRSGSAAAFAVAAKACRADPVTAVGGAATLYDCRGRASAILATANES